MFFIVPILSEAEDINSIEIEWSRYTSVRSIPQSRARGAPALLTKVTHESVTPISQNARSCFHNPASLLEFNDGPNKIRIS